MTIEQIIKEVAEANGFTVDDIRSSSRERGIIDVRQFAAYLAYYSMPNKTKAAEMIGELINRERTTVLWSVNRVVERILSSDPIIVDVLRNCRAIQVQTPIEFQPQLI